MDDLIVSFGSLALVLRLVILANSLLGIAPAERSNPPSAFRADVLVMARYVLRKERSLRCFVSLNRVSAASPSPCWLIYVHWWGTTLCLSFGLTCPRTAAAQGRPYRLSSCHLDLASHYVRGLSHRGYLVLCDPLALV